MADVLGDCHVPAGCGGRVTRLEEIRLAPDLKAIGINAVTGGGLGAITAETRTGRLVGIGFVVLGVVAYWQGKRWE